MLEGEWKLVSGGEVEPVLPEVPPTLASWFTKGNYNEFELLRKAFKVEVHYNNKTTSLFQLLQEITNFNLERTKLGKSKASSSRASFLEEKQLWKFFGAFMVRQLQLNGSAEKAGWAGKDIHEAFIGKCRFKV